MSTSMNMKLSSLFGWYGSSMYGGCSKTSPSLVQHRYAVQQFSQTRRHVKNVRQLGFVGIGQLPPHCPYDTIITTRNNSKYAKLGGVGTRVNR